MDDEEAVRQVLVEALEQLGLRTEAVADGPAAIEAVRTANATGDRYDLAILDLTIAGGIGGIETLERIREIHPSIKAVAMSGYTSDQVIAEPEDFTFQAAIAKPFLVDEVHRIMTALLSD
jgi:CheY-like chemotaxis protein